MIISKSKKTATEIQAILVDALMKAVLLSGPASLSLWLPFSLWSGINQTSPILFQTHVVIFSLEVIGNCLVWRHFNNTPIQNFAQQEAFLIGFQLLATLHWGMLTTYTIYACDLTQAQQDMLLTISVGYASISGTLWSIAQPMGLITTSLMIGPYLLTSYWLKDENTYFNILLFALLLFFLHFSSRLILRTTFLQLASEYNLLQIHADSMEHLSKLDFVTKLLNRFYFLLEYEMLWRNAKRTKKPLSLICVSVDEIEQVNSQHGHQVGDVLIAASAGFLNHAYASHNAVLGRYDSNLLMIALPNTIATQANAYINTQCQIMRQQIFFPQQLNVPVNCSYSVASTTDAAAGTTSQALIDHLIKQLSTHR